MTKQKTKIRRQKSEIRLLREIKRELTGFRNQFKQAYDSRELLIIRPYRCGQVAEHINKLIKKIEKSVKRIS